MARKPAKKEMCTSIRFPPRYASRRKGNPVVSKGRCPTPPEIVRDPEQACPLTRTRFRFFLSLWALLLLARPLACAYAQDATLSWAPSTDAAYYVVYWGTEPGTYTQTSENIAQPAPLPLRITHTVTGLAEATTYFFAVKAFNACDQPSGFSSEVSKTIAPTEANQPPTAYAGPDLSIPETTGGSPTPVTLSSSGSADPDGSIAGYAWARTDPHTDVSLVLQNADTAAASFFAPDVTGDTTLEFELTVTDDNGASATDRVLVTVVNADQPEGAGAATLRWAPSADAAYYVVYWGTEPGTYTRNSAPITQPSPLPAEITHRVSGLVEDVTYYFAVKAFNACDQSSDFSGEVATTIPLPGENLPPTAYAGADRSIPETTGGSPTAVSLSSSGSADPDGSIVGYAWTRTDTHTGVSLVLQDAGTASASFLAPEVTGDTVLEFELTVTDNDGASATDRVQVTVTDVVQLAGAATLRWAPSADAAYYVVYWGTEPGAYPQSSAPIAQPVPLPPEITHTVSGLAEAATYYFAVKAFNACDQGSDFSREVATTIPLPGGNLAPRAYAGADQSQPETTGGVPTLIRLDATGSTDADGTLIAYHWARVDAHTDITTILSSPTAAQPSFNAPAVAADTTLAFELTVTDNNGATATDRVQTTITNVNQAPTASAGPDQALPETTDGVPTTVRLDGTGSRDPDGSIKGYAWTRTDTETAIAVTLQNPGTATPSFAAPAVPTNTTLEFELTVTDNDGASATDRVRTTIANINQAPIASAGPDLTIPETTDGSPTTVTLNGTGSKDPDGTISSYAWARTDANTKVDVSLQHADTATPTFVSPDIKADTPLEFTLTVTDGEGATAQDAVQVTLTWVNRKPKANAGPNQTADPETSVTLSGANSSDPDGTITSFAWTQEVGTDDPVVTLSGADTETATFTSPEVDADGSTLTFRLTVTDNDEATHSATSLVNVTYENQPPVAHAEPELTAREGEAVTLSAEASSDPDGDPIALYLWEQLDGPPVELTQADTALAAFTAPDVGPAGTSLTFRVKVTDSRGLSATAQSVVNVTFVNQPPVADAGADLTLPEGSTVTLSAADSMDPDDGIASYTWSQTLGPPANLSDATAMAPALTLPPVLPEGSGLTFMVTVTDRGGLTATDTVSITVSNQNRQPVAEAGATQTVRDGDEVTLSAAGSSDPDGPLASYLWTQTSGPAVTLSDASAESPVFTARAEDPRESILNFELRVTDPEGLTATDTCTIRVLAANQAPVAHAGVDQFVLEGETVTLNGTASRDPDGDGIATWAWEQTAGPSVTLTPTGEAVVHFVAPKSTPGGMELAFTLTVTDNGGLSGTDTCTVMNTLVQTDPTAETANASIEILDSEMAHKDWLSIGWDAYRKANNEARVASGDLDGDGYNELVIGLGPVEEDPAIPGGFFQIISHDFKHLAWGQVPWEEYNAFNGETWPACGDLDGDGIDEIVVGLGRGGQGKVAVFSYSLGHVAHQQWVSLPWDAYNETLGETRPACGNIDGDACMEIIVGLGADPENGLSANGRYAIFDRPCEEGPEAPFELKDWGQGQWAEYNALNGATWPSCGDMDGDGQDEILLGLGAGGEGKTEIATYENGAPIHHSWLTVDWFDYNSQRGETRPACSDIDADGVDEVIIGLGPVPSDEQLPEGRFPTLKADQTVYQWGQLGLTPYNRSNGESRPTHFISNGENLVAIGMGPYTPGEPPDEGEDADMPTENGAAGCFLDTCGQGP